EDKDRLRGDGVLETVKGGLLVTMPRPTGVLGGEVKERACNMGEVTDETPVEVDKAQERLNLLLISWRGPLLHSSHLNRVYLSGIMKDNEPKVLNT
ncbi:hypothetical protein H0H93_012989, partial [Arthromyces matolae]